MRDEGEGVVVVTLRELEALHELPHLAQVLYLRGLRPHMDSVRCPRLYKSSAFLRRVSLTVSLLPGVFES